MSENDLVSTEVYCEGSWYTKDFKISKSFEVRQPRAIKTYQIWEDQEGEEYWAIVGQDLGEGVEDKTEDILRYSQEDNWLVETYKMSDGLALTKHYRDYYPNVINEGSVDLYHFDTYKSRTFSHHYKFGNPYSKYFFDGFDGYENLNESETSKEDRLEFHEEAIRQHEMFSDATGCYFSDIDPNNFLVNVDYTDSKIIDIYSIEVGDIRDYVDHNDSNIKWPLPDYRTVGPVWSDRYIKNGYMVL